MQSSRSHPRGAVHASIPLRSLFLESMMQRWLEQSCSVIMSLPLNLQSLLAQSGPKATPLNQVIPSVASAPPKSAPASAGKPIEPTADIVSINDRDVDSSARAVIADITKYNAAFKFRTGRSIACSRLSAPRLPFICVLFPSNVQHCCAGILLTQYVMARCVL